ncbi:MAG: hypothetical protein LQ348_007289 [Seirophora lacunosa]|nr:MAG: hypothetical protein LQ348_007289 [Seirophora lacunosa]
MDTIFQTFHQAQFSGSGPHLATTLTPIAPPHDSTLLRRFHKDSNVFSIQKDIESYIRIQQSHLSKTESTAWIDIYVAYWKAIGEILRAETGHHRDDWAIKVYEAWKEVTNLLIRGYSHAGFGAWTMPCLYTVSKYLRVFAIKADEEQAVKVGSGEVKMESDALGDDVMAGFEKNERLEDAARVINRIFTLCISDRAPIEESRKFGLYYTTNLLFKTYFKVSCTLFRQLVSLPVATHDLSSSTPSASPRTVSAPLKPQGRTCHQWSSSPNRTSSRSDTTSA